MSTNVVSFVEESCFTGDQFKSVRRQVWFTVNVYGQFKGDFECDNGIWYDSSDDYLLQFLYQLQPETEWGYFTYHRRLDHSSVSILHPESGKEIGSIYVRRGSKQNLSGEMEAGNVIQWSDVIQWKEERDSRSSEGEG